MVMRYHFGLGVGHAYAHTLESADIPQISPEHNTVNQDVPNGELEVEDEGVGVIERESQESSNKDNMDGNDNDWEKVHGSNSDHELEDEDNGDTSSTHSTTENDDWEEAHGDYESEDESDDDEFYAMQEMYG